MALWVMVHSPLTDHLLCFDGDSQSSPRQRPRVSTALLEKVCGAFHCQGRSFLAKRIFQITNSVHVTLGAQTDLAVRQFGRAFNCELQHAE